MSLVSAFSDSAGVRRGGAWRRLRRRSVSSGFSHASGLRGPSGPSGPRPTTHGAGFPGGGSPYRDVPPDAQPTARTDGALRICLTCFRSVTRVPGACPWCGRALASLDEPPAARRVRWEAELRLAERSERERRGAMLVAGAICGVIYYPSPVEFLFAKFGVLVMCCTFFGALWLVLGLSALLFPTSAIGIERARRRLLLLERRLRPRPRPMPVPSSVTNGLVAGYQVERVPVEHLLTWMKIPN